MASERILAVGRIHHGEIMTKHVYIEYLCSITDDEEPLAPSGHPTLQAVIDYSAELEELIDGRLDDEYHASGNW